MLKKYPKSSFYIPKAMFPLTTTHTNITYRYHARFRRVSPTIVHQTSQEFAVVRESAG